MGLENQNFSCDCCESPQSVDRIEKVIENAQKQHDIPTPYSVDCHLVYIDDPALSIDAKTCHHEIKAPSSRRSVSAGAEVLAASRSRSTATTASRASG